MTLSHEPPIVPVPERVKALPLWAQQLITHLARVAETERDLAATAQNFADLAERKTHAGKQGPFRVYCGDWLMGLPPGVTVTYVAPDGASVDISEATPGRLKLEAGTAVLTVFPVARHHIEVWAGP